MEFLNVSTLADAFHYTSKLEAKQKGKIRFVNKPTNRTSDKKSPANSNKFKNPSQPTPPKPDHQKKKFQKDKRDRNKQAPTGKWCDYHSSSWHDKLECKARKTFLAKLSTSDLFHRTLVESNPDASTLLALTLISSTASTIVDEEEQERLFHTWRWVQNNPLHLIMDNSSHKNFVSEYIVKKLGLVTTPHPQPYNIGWMKDGQELRIT